MVADLSIPLRIVGLVVTEHARSTTLKFGQCNKKSIPEEGRIDPQMPWNNGNGWFRSRVNNTFLKPLEASGMTLHFIRTLIGIYWSQFPTRKWTAYIILLALSFCIKLHSAFFWPFSYYTTTFGRLKCIITVSSFHSFVHIHIDHNAISYQRPLLLLALPHSQTAIRSVL